MILGICFISKGSHIAVCLIPRRSDSHSEIISSWKKKGTRRTPYVPKQSPCGGNLRDLCTHSNRHVATQQSRRLPVEIFANPTGVTNVYADGITFCLRMIGDVSQGHKFLIMHSSQKKPEINVLQQTLPSNAYSRGPSVFHCEKEGSLICGSSDQPHCCCLKGQS